MLVALDWDCDYGKPKPKPNPRTTISDESPANRITRSVSSTGTLEKPIKGVDGLLWIRSTEKPDGSDVVFEITSNLFTFGFVHEQYKLFLFCSCCCLIRYLC